MTPHATNACQPRSNRRVVDAHPDWDIGVELLPLPSTTQPLRGQAADHSTLYVVAIRCHGQIPGKDCSAPSRHLAPLREYSRMNVGFGNAFPGNLPGPQMVCLPRPGASSGGATTPAAGAVVGSARTRIRNRQRGARGAGRPRWKEEAMQLGLRQEGPHASSDLPSHAAPDGMSAYVQGMCAYVQASSAVPGVPLPPAEAIVAACLASCDVALASRGVDLFELSSTDVSRLDGSIKVKGVVVRLRNIPSTDVCLEVVLPIGVAPPDMVELVRLVDESEDVLLAPFSTDSGIFLRPAEGTSVEAALALCSRAIRVNLDGKLADLRFRIVLPARPPAAAAIADTRPSGALRFRAVPPAGTLPDQASRAWASLASVIVNCGCGVEITHPSQDGEFALSPSVFMDPEAAAELLLGLNPIRSRGINLTFERVVASAPAACGSATAPSPPGVVPPLGIDRVIIWHDIENAPLPSKVIMRGADGRPQYDMPVVPHGKPCVKFRNARPDGSDDIRGGAIVAEALRTALACVAPLGAAHPALAVDGATLKHSLLQFEYRVFLRRNATNPFHPSSSTWSDLVAWGATLCDPLTGPGSADLAIQNNMTQYIRGFAGTREVKARTLLVLISADGDYAGVVTFAQQEGFPFVIIAGADSLPRSSFLELVPRQRSVVCWERIVEQARGRLAPLRPVAHPLSLVPQKITESSDAIPSVTSVVPVPSMNCPVMGETSAASLNTSAASTSRSYGGESRKRGREQTGGFVSAALHGDT